MKQVTKTGFSPIAWIKHGISQRGTPLKRFEQPLIALLCGIPLIGLLMGELGPQPVETLLKSTGLWGLQLLLATLCLSPLRRLTGWTIWIRSRRTLGLSAFGYISLHFATYAVIDQRLAIDELIADILYRPYITVGLTAFCLLIPLALTSTRYWMKKLGVYWKRLHQLNYLATGLGVIHFIWLVKIDLTTPLLYAALLTGLLAFRIPWGRFRKWG